MGATLKYHWQARIEGLVEWRTVDGCRTHGEAAVKLANAVSAPQCTGRGGIEVEVVRTVVRDGQPSDVESRRVSLVSVTRWEEWK